MANNRNQAIRGETVELSIQYYGTDGLARNADSTPQIKLVDVDGETAVTTTSVGVTKEDTGLYVYSYDVGDTVNTGLWTDTWTAEINELALCS